MVNDKEVLANTAKSLFHEKRSFDEHLSEMYDYNIELERKSLKLFSKELEILRKFEKYPMPSNLKSVLNHILKHRANPQIFAEIQKARQEIREFYEKYKKWNDDRKASKGRK